MNTNLIEKLASAYSDREAFRPTFEAAMERRDAELERRTGISRHWGFRTDDESRRHGVVMRVLDEEMGIHAILDKMEELNARLDPVVAIITTTPARDLADLADLALKANAVASAYEHLWASEPDELDYGDELLRDLIENLCSVAGVNLMVSQRLAPRTDLN
jgi:hypothetical protein